MKPSPALSEQLALFTPNQLPGPLVHNADDLSPPEVATWVLAHGTGRLSRPERSFLFGISTQGKTLSESDWRQLSRLHERIGHRALSPWFPWQMKGAPRRMRRRNP